METMKELGQRIFFRSLEEEARKLPKLVPGE
jgi:hypothetical protein